MIPRPVILLVDDDPIAVSMVKAALVELADYNVVTAGTIGEARQMAELHTPALFVIDLYLGGENGFDLVTWVRQHPLLADAMIMMLTGAGETKTKIQGYETGVDDYVVKPFHPLEFLSRIRALMRIKGMQEELKADREELARVNAVLGAHLDALTTLLLNIISLRVPDAAERSREAARFAQWLCERLGVPAEVAQVIILSARLHEIGKVIVGDGVLCKPRAEWTEDDREAMAQYPLFSHMIVGNVEQLREVGRLLRHQAENYDGTGGPDRLIADQIPLGARILRVINAIEARGDAPLEEIRQHLEEGQGTRYDARIVRIAVEYLQTVADPTWMHGKKELAIAELVPGVKLAADLVTSGGIKLLPAGTTLTATMVERILSRHALDPIITRAYIHL